MLCLLFKFPDIEGRRMSVHRGKNRELQQTIMEGKQTSDRLRTVQEQMEEAASRGEDVNGFKM